MLFVLKGNSRGVSLVEIMISVLVFAIGLSAILSVCVQSMMMTKRSDAAYLAYNIAKNHLETLKTMPVTDLTAAAETATVLDAYGVPDPSGTFTRTTTVASSYLGDPNLIQATVKVNYLVRGKASTLPMEMTTVIYKNA